MNFRGVVKKLIPVGLFDRIEPAGHLAEAMVRNVQKGFPAKGLKIIGVTGTDGKTTTCTMIAQMLRNSGVKVGLITTVFVDYGDEAGEQLSPTQKTTPGVGQLLDMLKKMKQNGVQWVVLETSSHALAQHRVWGLPYEIAVMTNVTHEHLDYHKTFERYRDAKRMLFKQTNRNKGLRVGIVNAEDPSAELFAGDIAHPLGYGVKSGDLRALDVKPTTGGSRFLARLGEDEYKIDCHLPGTFNVYNALAAVAVGRIVGLTKEQIEKGIASLQRVPGRMESIDAGQPFGVVVDYAVTPEALSHVLESAQTVATGDVHIVFGATGDRDKTKRPLMGEVTAKLADHIYLTDDETYTEDPDAIRQAVYEGIDKVGGAAKTAVIADRKTAIKAAFDAAQPGDIVLLTGIGHQKYRTMGTEKQPWDERDIARGLLQKH